MIKTNYKQIIIICGILLAIIAGIFIYLYQNQDIDYSFLEVSNNINNEEISNNIEVEEKIVIHIAGQVVNPGIVELNKDARIVEAIEAAGGITSEANLDKINLAYVLEDGMKIYIPSTKDGEETGYVTTENTGNSTSSSNQTIRININTASSEDFEKIPGIGSSIASRIVEYRKENGKFSSIEDIKNVSGIGEAKFKNIKNYIYVK